jgi:hypothetical protein
MDMPSEAARAEKGVTEYRREWDRLEGEFSHLTEQYNLLESALTPVLHPADPEPSDRLAKQQEVPPSWEIGSDLRGLEERIANLRSRLTTLYKRLAI